MNEVIILLLIIVGWLGYRGYLALCDYLLEKIVMMLHAAMLGYGFVRLLC